MRARVRLLAVAVLLATGASALPGHADDRLGASRRELEEATSALAGARATVDRAAADLATTDERLATASTELARLEDDLEVARQGHEAATAAEEAALADLVQADARLETLRGEHDTDRRRLGRRTAHAFKHGAALPRDALVRGVTNAGDWHEIAVTLHTVDRLVDEDRAAIGAAAATLRASAPVHADALAARREAVEAARIAAAHAEEVADLEAAHGRTVADLTRDQDHRRSVLALLERDADARAEVVARLDEQVRRLERDAARRAAEAEAARAAAARAAAGAGAAGTHPPAAGATLPEDGPPPVWASRLPEAGHAWASTIDAVAARHGLDGRLLAALVWTESNFRPQVVSHAGAIGLAQLMPGTARGLGVDPWDARQNLEGGARYLATQLARFGSPDLALAAYNAGPNRVRGGRIPDIVETQLYVVRVLERYELLASGRRG